MLTFSRTHLTAATAREAQTVRAFLTHSRAFATTVAAQLAARRCAPAPLQQSVATGQALQNHLAAQQQAAARASLGVTAEQAAQVVQQAEAAVTQSVVVTPAVQRLALEGWARSLAKRGRRVRATATMLREQSRAQRQQHPRAHPDRPQR
jgi:hypothetical protein